MEEYFQFQISNNMKKLYIYGARAILEAIESSIEIDRVWIDKSKQSPTIKEVIRLCKIHGIPMQFVPEEKLSSFKDKNHQGIVAKSSLVEFQSLENIIVSTYQKGEMPFILILDGITDVRNFGAISRTALSAGVHAIVIEQKGYAQINEDAIKTSAGALLHVPICREESLKKTVDLLKLHGLNIVVCTEKAQQNIYEIPLKNPTALILGSEEKGVNPSLIKVANYLASIPMYGKVSSLNVSVASGVVLYECVRQRNYNDIKS